MSSINNFVSKVLGRNVEVVDPTQYPLYDGPIYDANTSVYDYMFGAFTFVTRIMRRILRFGT